MDDLVKRLRAMGDKRANISPAWQAAIDQAAVALEAKDAEIARLRALLNEVLPTDAPVWFDEAEARGWACGWNDARVALQAGG